MHTQPARLHMRDQVHRRERLELTPAGRFWSLYAAGCTVVIVVLVTLGVLDAAEERREASPALQRYEFQIGGTHDHTDRGR